MVRQGEQNGPSLFDGLLDLLGSRPIRLLVNYAVPQRVDAGGLKRHQEWHQLRITQALNGFIFWFSLTVGKGCHHVYRFREVLRWAPRHHVLQEQRSHAPDGVFLDLVV